jgi:serine/threonine protein phosphatase PrpC
LGDFELKENNVISYEPFINKIDLKDEDIDFVLLASDGLWCGKDRQKVADYISEQLETNQSLESIT